MDFMRLRNESKTNDDIGGDFHRDYLSIRISLLEWKCRSVRVTSAYVGMQSLLQSCVKAMMWRVPHITICQNLTQ